MTTGLFRRLRSHGSPAEESKASRVAPLLSFQFAGHPHWSSRNFASLVRAGYTRNPIVYRCVRLISEAAAAVPWTLDLAGKTVTEHAVLDLLARPSERQAGVAFLEALFGYLLLAGDAYVEAVMDEDHLAELHVLRPDRMKILLGRDGWPEGYEYSVAGRSVRFPAAAQSMAPILALSLFHPLEDHGGFAPLEAAQASLDLHNASSHWNKALLDNSARPSGALIYHPADGMHLSDVQFDRLKAELEQGFQGASQAGRPLLLEGGLDWKSMALSPKDMDFQQAKNNAAREIALCFGVPPQMLGIPGDNTYANYAEANRAFLKHTILPLINRTAQAFSNWFAPHFGADLHLRHDLDAIDGLAAEREALWKRINEATFLTDEEKRSAVGYGSKS